MFDWERKMRELNAHGIREIVGITDPTILEIGCNDGTDTLHFLEEMPEARIYCFEPDPRAIERFHSFVDDERVVLMPFALGEVSEIKTFYGSSGIPPEKSRNAPKASHYCALLEWDLSGSLAKATGHLAMSPWVTFPEDREFDVLVETLDNWLPCHSEIITIDFIWMDVQGYEDSVIRGATKALSITRFLYTEYSDKELYAGQKNLNELHALLPDFSLLGTYGDNALFKNQKLC